MLIKCYIGDVTTFAGTGEAGSVDGSSVIVKFNYPTDVAVNNTTGDVYVCDYGNNKIRKVTPDSKFVAVYICYVHFCGFPFTVAVV